MFILLPGMAMFIFPHRWWFLFVSWLTSQWITKVDGVNHLLLRKDSCTLMISETWPTGWDLWTRPCVNSLYNISTFFNLLFSRANCHLMVNRKEEFCRGYFNKTHCLVWLLQTETGFGSFPNPARLVLIELNRIPVSLQRAGGEDVKLSLQKQNCAQDKRGSSLWYAWGMIA